ncbi:hypothetical protein ACMWDE_27405, partial [Klebsiella pneumoniae]
MVKVISIFFLYSSIILPTGIFLGINIKILSVFLFLLSFCIEKKFYVFSSIIKNMLPVLIFILLLIFYSFFVNNNTELVFFQARDIITFFVVCIIINSYFNNSEMSDKALYHISNALVISAIIKLFIIAYSVMFSVPIIQAVKSYGAFFETSLMTYAVEDSVIGRI